MDLLDAIIILLVLGALASGWRRGLTWVGLSLLGLVLGLVLGALIAPPLARRFADHQPEAQSLIGTGVFLAMVAIVQGLGTAAGYWARTATIRTKFARVDSWLGSVLAAFGVLAGAWYLGLIFADSPWVPLDQQIQGSGILRTLDGVAPRPPAFLASIEQLLRGTSFPNPFATLAPELLPPVQIPQAVDTPGIKAAAAVVSKVLSYGCGVEAGSSFPLGNDYMVTNAHVVAGSDRVDVERPDGRTFPATVVLFDPEVDVAVLRVPGIGFSSLHLVDSDPSRGTDGAVIGYPGGGGEQAVPMAVRGVETAQGRDIYGAGLVQRRIEVLAAHVIPGNSGGPAVDRDGNVIGLVFAASTVDPTEGYALTVGQISGDLTQGEHSTAAVSTQSCTS
ncbi:MAG TPA: MarP family serine protease [Candidatus Dormibacteraeota bacterium]|nr:MarP family serine protease [Candidatus Dormibacteraeota bacterium]